MSEVRETVEPGSWDKGDEMTDAVTADGLVKHYKDVKAVDGVSLRVPEGSVLGVLGPNGAGKTTTVRILTTLSEPTEGRAVEGVDLVLVDGEVRVKGPMVMRGYIDSSLDAESFDENGYLGTGGLAELDDAGNVRITGRVKDIIIRNMENISAKEVEDLLFTHPAVADAAVIGLPDDRTGERVCAVVVLAEGAEAPSLADLVEFTVANGLAKQKTPEQLEILPALPRNPTGKVLKHELRASYAR